MRKRLEIRKGHNRNSSPAHLYTVRGKWKEPRNCIGTRLGQKLCRNLAKLSTCYDILEWIQIIHDYFLHALCNLKQHVTPILHWLYQLKKENFAQKCHRNIERCHYLTLATPLCPPRDPKHLRQCSKESKRLWI